MQADLELKQKQAKWETPRNLILIVVGATSIISLLFGVAGYKLGQTPPPAQLQPIIIYQMPPPAAPAPAP